MSHNAPGRHRSSQPVSPLREIATVVGRSASPAVKSSAVLAAAGGLVAAFAVPATAASAAPQKSTASQAAAARLASTQVASRSFTRPTLAAPAAAPAVAAPAVAAPARTAAFGVTGYTAVAKPKPKPAPVIAATPSHTRQGALRAASAGTSSVAARTYASDKAAAGGVIAIAQTLLGIPYVYGGTTPAGFDCSGFTQYIFRKVGINLPRTAEQQRQYSTRVSDPQPGDLVFFGAPAYHVGIYAGPGMMYDSPTTGKVSSLRKIWTSNVTYGRP